MLYDDLFAPFNNSLLLRQCTFYNMRERIRTLGEYVDLIDQIYLNGNGLPSAAPLHAHGRCNIVPWWYNFAKGGGFDLSLQLVLVAALVRQTNLELDTDRDMDQIACVIRAAHPVDAAFKTESHGWVFGFDYNGKQTVIELAERLRNAFSPEGTEIYEGLSLDQPGPVDVKVALQAFRQERGVKEFKNFYVPITKGCLRRFLVLVDELE